MLLQTTKPILDVAVACGLHVGVALQPLLSRAPMAASPATSAPAGFTPRRRAQAAALNFRFIARKDTTASIR